MREENNNTNMPYNSILTEEQDQILDMYIQRMDEYFESIKASEKMEVDIETLHLKRILAK